jgi:hypothetical protein
MSEHLPSLYELVSEPNVTKLDEHTRQFGHEGVLRGKFVRIGRLVLLAPDTTVERLPGMRTGDVEHKDIVKAAFRNPNRELAERALAESNAAHELPDTPLLDDNFGLTDAGHFEFSSEGRVLAVFHKSHKFGQADVSGRQETIRIAQESVGSDIAVSLAA